MTGLETLEDAFDADSALVFGVGGSGDIVGSIPTAHLLEDHGVKVTLGGLAWEPAPYDPTLGPRSFDEIENLDRVNDVVGLASGDTTTVDDVEFTETRVARYYDEQVVLVDMCHGVEKVRSGLDAACDALGFDVVVGVDAGGDVLARGDEPGLRSPLTDGYGAIALADIAHPACLGVYGYGSDGELTIDELESAIGRIASRDGLLGAWGLTRRVREELTDLLECVDTEASRLPVEAAGGALGRRTIRDGEVSLELTPPSTVTFYFDPAAVAAQSEIVSCLRDTDSLERARSALREAGYTTEFDIEQRRIKQEDNLNPP